MQVNLRYRSLVASQQNAALRHLLFLLYAFKHFLSVPLSLTLCFRVLFRFCFCGLRTEAPICQLVNSPPFVILHHQPSRDQVGSLTVNHGWQIVDRLLAQRPRGDTDCQPEAEHAQLEETLEHVTFVNIS